MDKNRLILIAGPCCVEDYETCDIVAGTVLKICQDLGISYIFKSSIRKANRTKLDSFSGIGDDKALDILKRIKEKYSIPILTDVHEVDDCIKYATIADYLQVPAFLCRQTDLIASAAVHSKLGIAIKKGQFMSGSGMKYAMEKAKENTNTKIFLIERGNSFGYNDLVVDFTNIVTMKKFANVIMDCTHATQRPNQETGITGGNPEMIETLALCAISSGADGLFIETHPNPHVSKSDGANMLHLDKLKSILEKCIKVRNILTL